MHHTERSSTCRIAAAAIAGAISAALGGCAVPRPATSAELSTRAAFDLSCPAYQLQIYPLGPVTKGVVGCGRRLTYIEVCQNIRAKPSCSWTLDSPTFVQAPAAPRWLAPASVPRDPPPAAPAAAEPPGEHDPAEPASDPPAAGAPASSAPTHPIRDFGF